MILCKVNGEQLDFGCIWSHETGEIGESWFRFRNIPVQSVRYMNFMDAVDHTAVAVGIQQVAASQD